MGQNSKFQKMIIPGSIRQVFTCLEPDPTGSALLLRIQYLHEEWLALTFFAKELVEEISDSRHSSLQHPTGSHGSYSGAMRVLLMQTPQDWAAPSSFLFLSFPANWHNCTENKHGVYGNGQRLLKGKGILITQLLASQNNSILVNNHSGEYNLNQ